MMQAARLAPISGLQGTDDFAFAKTVLRRGQGLAGLLSAWIVAAGPALADEDEQAGVTDDSHAHFVERDAKGNRTGTVEEETPGYLVQRDNKGARTGTIQCDGITDQCVTYDTRGRRTGTIDRH